MSNPDAAAFPSNRDVQELLHPRGMVVSHETLRGGWVKVSFATEFQVLPSPVNVFHLRTNSTPCSNTIVLHPTVAHAVSDGE